MSCAIYQLTKHLVFFIIHLNYIYFTKQFSMGTKVQSFGIISTFLTTFADSFRHICPDPIHVMSKLINLFFPQTFVISPTPFLA